MGAPLVVEFEVQASPEHAFATWTRRCASWWPASHTVSGDPTTITFEPHAGGRIIERAAGDAEHEWGRVLDWEPPRRVRLLWHLFFDPSEATEVDLTFTKEGPLTRVRLQQSGWERLGEAGEERRTRTEQSWSTLAVAFARAAQGAAS